jgi:hypothetical protein
MMIEPKAEEIPAAVPPIARVRRTSAAVTDLAAREWMAMRTMKLAGNTQLEKGNGEHITFV